MLTLGSTKASALAVGVEFASTSSGVSANLPARVALIGQGSTGTTFSTDKLQVTSAAQVASTYGQGSPLHLAALQLMPPNGGGLGAVPLTVYPLEDDAGGAAATGSVTVVGSVTTASSARVVVNNIQSQSFSLVVGDSVAAICAKIKTAIDAILKMPVTTTDNGTEVALTSKWKGSSGNDLHIEFLGGADSGLTFSVTAMAGGSGNPDVDSALNQLGNSHETHVVNCLEVTDTTTLDKINAAGEQRWEGLEAKPFIAFTGGTAATAALATAVSSTKSAQRVNALVTDPGSKHLPLEIAAATVAAIAPIAHAGPAEGYNGVQLVNLTASADSGQWNLNERNLALLGGSGNIANEGGVATIGDLVTFYNDVAEENPAYQFVDTTIKVMNLMYSVRQTLDNPAYKGASIIPDGQVVNSGVRAVSPKEVKAALAGTLSALEAQAIIADADESKAGLSVVISPSNNRRFDVVVPAKVTGNLTQIDALVQWSFNFGGA